MFILEFGDVAADAELNFSTQGTGPSHPTPALLVELCRWEIRISTGEFAANSDSTQVAIADALSQLEGRTASSLVVESVSALTTLVFEDGATLKARPEDSGTYGPDPQEMWTLYKPDGSCLTVRDDATFTDQPCALPTADGDWTTIPPAGITAD